jgi:hypothetical protein
MTKEDLLESLKERFGISTNNAYSKKTYLKDGVPHVGLYGYELNNDFYFYHDYSKTYYKLVHNPNYKSKYEYEIFQGKNKYQVPLDDFEVLIETEPEEYKEQEDATFMGETTLRDLAAILLKKPVSNKPWLNDIINK